MRLWKTLFRVETDKIFLDFIISMNYLFLLGSLLQVNTGCNFVFSWTWEIIFLVACLDLSSLQPCRVEWSCLPPVCLWIFKCRHFQASKMAQWVKQVLTTLNNLNSKKNQLPKVVLWSPLASTYNKKYINIKMKHLK